MIDATRERLYQSVHGHEVPTETRDFIATTASETLQIIPDAGSITADHNAAIIVLACDFREVWSDAVLIEICLTDQDAAPFRIAKLITGASEDVPPVVKNVTLNEPAATAVAKNSYRFVPDF